MYLLAMLLLAAPSDYATNRGTAGISASVSGQGNLTVGATYFVFNDVAARIDIGLDAPLTPGGAGQNMLYSLGGGLRFYHSSAITPPSFSSPPSPSARRIRLR